MSEIQFGEKDRQRWDLPEWLEWDPRDVATADLEELSERFAFDLRDWPTVLFGELTLEQAGDPDAVPVPPKWQTRALAWMSLRQNGRMVSWDEAGEARGAWFKFRSPGKARGQSQDTSKPSDAPAPSTTQRSQSSSATRKSK